MEDKNFLFAKIVTIAVLLAGAGCINTRELGQSARSAGYSVEPVPLGMILKDPAGQEVFRYMTKKPQKTNLAANSVCCFHPLNTPTGIRVTDLAPGDHHHHRGVFLAWHTMEFWNRADFSGFGPLGPTHGWDISRGDFWGWGQYAPTEGVVIQSREIKPVALSFNSAELKILNDWLIGGKVMMTEATTVKVRKDRGAYVMDLDYNLKPNGKMVLNQTAFGGFCVRARNDGESNYYSPRGKILLPDPHYSAPDLNWPAMDWCDFTINLEEGKTVGVAILDHPKNPPSTWHNPRYIWMLNPCITDRGPITVEEGNSLRLQYRLVVHDGPTPMEQLNELSREWRQQ